MRLILKDKEWGGGGGKMIEGIRVSAHAFKVVHKFNYKMYIDPKIHSLLSIFSPPPAPLRA